MFEINTFCEKTFGDEIFCTKKFVTFFQLVKKEFPHAGQKLFCWTGPNDFSWLFLTNDYLN